MTAQASAVPQSTGNKKNEKILRIGIVQGGRIMEERLLRAREALTVGQSSRNKFIVASPGVPVSYQLIAVRSGQYQLVFEKGMLGKVLVGDEVLDLKTIAQRGLAERKDNKFYFPLSTECRGKVVLGDVTLLFQFVSSPPEVPRMELPFATRGSLFSNMDKPLWVSLLVSALVLGGSVGYLEVEWRYTGRYMAKVKKKSPKLLQALVSVSVEKPEEDDAQKDDKGNVVDAGNELVDNAPRDDERKQVDARGIAEASAKAGAGQAIASGGMDSQNSANLGIVDPGAAVDLGRVADSINVGAPDTPARGGPTRVVGPAGPAKSGGFMVSSKYGSGPKVRDGGYASGGGAYRGAGSLTSLGGGSGGSNYLTDSDYLIGGGGGGGGGGPRVGLAGGAGGLGGNVPDTPTLVVGPKVDIGSSTIGQGIGKEVQVERPVVKDTRLKIAVDIGGATGVAGGDSGDASEADEYLRRLEPKFRRCFLDFNLASKEVAGSVTLYIKIGTSGAARATVRSNSTKDPAFAECMVNQVNSVTFSPRDKELSFSKKISFRPSSK